MSLRPSVLATVVMIAILPCLVTCGGCDMEDTRYSGKSSGPTSTPPPTPAAHPPVPEEIEDLYEYALHVVALAAHRMPKVPAITFELAKMHQRFGFDDKAIKTYQRGLDIMPNRPDAHVSVGFLLSQREKFARAQAAYKAALALNPKIAGAHTRLGMIRSHEGKNDEAIREYEIEIKNGTADSLTYFNLGQALVEKKGFARAVKAFKQCLELEPNHQNGLYAIAHAYRKLKKNAEYKRYSEKYQKRREFELAMKQKHGVGRPRDGELRNAAETCAGVADFYLGLGHTDEGLRALEAASLFNPKDGKVAVKLVDNLRRSGKIKKGVDIGLRLADAQPHNVRLAYLLGGMCISIKMHAEARAMLLRFLERRPDDLEALRFVVLATLQGGLDGEDSPRFALEYATRAINKSRDWRTLDPYSYALYSNGRVKEAEEALIEGIDLLTTESQEKPDDEFLRRRLKIFLDRLQHIKKPTEVKRR